MHKSLAERYSGLKTTIFIRVWHTVKGLEIKVQPPNLASSSRKKRKVGSPTESYNPGQDDRSEGVITGRIFETPTTANVYPKRCFK